MDTIFSKRFRRAREQRNETQQDLADQFKVTRGMISHWEHGKYYPEAVKLIEIAEYFDASLDDLMGITVPSKDSVFALTQDEADLLKLYRSLSDERRKDVIDVMKTFQTKDSPPRRKSRK